MSVFVRQGLKNVQTLDTRCVEMLASPARVVYKILCIVSNAEERACVSEETTREAQMIETRSYLRHVNIRVASIDAVR